MNLSLSQQELQILVTILTQVKLSYKEYDLVKPLVDKLSSQIVQPQAQDIEVKVKEDNASPTD